MSLYIREGGLKTVSSKGSLRIFLEVASSAIAAPRFQTQERLLVHSNVREQENSRMKDARLTEYGAR